jgi:hypothetical protein
MRDAGQKNRLAVGERHGNALIDTRTVEAIRAAAGTQMIIAALYGVARQTVGDIKRGRRRVRG